MNFKKFFIIMCMMLQYTQYANADAYSNAFLAFDKALNSAATAADTVATAAAFISNNAGALQWTQTQKIAKKLGTAQANAIGMYVTEGNPNVLKGKFPNADTQANLLAALTAAASNTTTGTTAAGSTSGTTSTTTGTSAATKTGSTTGTTTAGSTSGTTSTTTGTSATTKTGTTAGTTTAGSTSGTTSTTTGTSAASGTGTTTGTTTAGSTSGTTSTTTGTSAATETTTTGSTPAASGYYLINNSTQTITSINFVNNSVAGVYTTTGSLTNQAASAVMQIPVGTTYYTATFSNGIVITNPVTTTANANIYSAATLTNNYTQQIDTLKIYGANGWVIATITNIAVGATVQIPTGTGYYSAAISGSLNSTVYVSTFATGALNLFDTGSMKNTSTTPVSVTYNNGQNASASSGYNSVTSPAITIAPGASIPNLTGANSISVTSSTGTVIVPANSPQAITTSTSYFISNAGVSTTAPSGFTLTNNSTLTISSINFINNSVTGVYTTTGSLTNQAASAVMQIPVGTTYYTATFSNGIVITNPVTTTANANIYSAATLTNNYTQQIDTLKIYGANGWAIATITNIAVGATVQIPAGSGYFGAAISGSLNSTVYVSTPATGAINLFDTGTMTNFTTGPVTATYYNNPTNYVTTPGITIAAGASIPNLTGTVGISLNGGSTTPTTITPNSSYLTNDGSTVVATGTLTNNYIEPITTINFQNGNNNGAIVGTATNIAVGAAISIPGNATYYTATYSAVVVCNPVSSAANVNVFTTGSLTNNYTHSIDSLVFYTSTGWAQTNMTNIPVGATVQIPTGAGYFGAKMTSSLGSTVYVSTKSKSMNLFAQGTMTNSTAAPVTVIYYNSPTNAVTSPGITIAAGASIPNLDEGTYISVTSSTGTIIIPASTPNSIDPKISYSISSTGLLTSAQATLQPNGPSYIQCTGLKNGNMIMFFNASGNPMSSISYSGQSQIAIPTGTTGMNFWGPVSPIQQVSQYGYIYSMNSTTQGSTTPFTATLIPTSNSSQNICYIQCNGLHKGNVITFFNGTNSIDSITYSDQGQMAIPAGTTGINFWGPASPIQSITQYGNVYTVNDLTQGAKWPFAVTAMPAVSSAQDTSHIQTSGLSDGNVIVYFNANGNAINYTTYHGGGNYRIDFPAGTTGLNFWGPGNPIQPIASHGYVYTANDRTQGAKWPFAVTAMAAVAANGNSYSSRTLGRMSSTKNKPGKTKKAKRGKAPKTAHA